MGRGQELPEVGSGTLVANFTCDPATMDLGPENDLLSWRAANNENLILVAEGSPSSNITFDPKELGGFGSLVVNDYSGENRRLEGSLGGVELSNATIFWVGTSALVGMVPWATSSGNTSTPWASMARKVRSSTTRSMTVASRSTEDRVPRSVVTSPT